VPSVLQMAIEL